MADGFSTAYINEFLDYITGGGAPTSVADFFVKLHIGDPGAAGTSNPATETTRQSPTFSAASGGAITNSGAAQWTNYPAAETVSWVSFWDASTAGNFLGKKSLTANRTPAIGDTLTLGAGDLDMSLAVAS